MSWNQCNFIGHLTNDPTTKSVGETTVTNFSIAVNRKYKSGGELREEVSFLDMVAWDKGGESIAKYFRKGDPILLNCSARQETWQNNDGQNRSKIVFRVESFGFLPKNDRTKSTERVRETVPAGEPSGAAGQDEIPF